MSKHQELMDKYPSYRKNCDENGNYVLDKFRRSPYSEVCIHCQHLISPGFRQCAAFPDEYGIPDEIWSGANKHQAPYPGDHGIQFVRYQPTKKPA